MLLPYRNGEVVSLLTWVQVLEACAFILLALGLLIVFFTWRRHLPWLLHLSALLPLAASVFAWVAAQHIHDTYLSTVQLEADFEGHGPLAFYQQLERMIDSNLHDASVFGWLVVIVTGVLTVAAYALGLWHGALLRGRQRQLA